MFLYLILKNYNLSCKLVFYLGTNRRENFFVMDFPAIRLIVHALNVILSACRCLCDPSDVLNAVLAGLSSPAKTLFNMCDGRYIHRSRHFY